MKSKLVAIAGGCASVCIAIASMNVNASYLNDAVTGSILCVEHTEEGTCARSVSNSVSVPMKRNGQKYISKNPNKAPSTAVGHSAIAPSLDPCQINDGEGFQYNYIFSTAVATAANGDLLVVALDETKANTVCVSPLGNFEVTVHRIVIGGTGRYQGACGSLVFNGAGLFLPPAPSTDFSAFEGIQTGKVFVGDKCPQ